MRVRRLRARRKADRIVTERYHRDAPPSRSDTEPRARHGRDTHVSLVPHLLA
ncbi:hypothetical protein HMPREF1979_01017 [Actinomyces johnsonii F0542]|uniref:Uncharacterized protein n=1 Tax=Actinomyces johnsonii F0542 TaxID=1321818 RepID=U1RYW6_9ACTO|nr:hypothetical protein HMPREF1979_01017 [Actinomyces johnsonii F0542]